MKSGWPVECGAKTCSQQPHTHTTTKNSPAESTATDDHSTRVVAPLYEAPTWLHALPLHFHRYPGGDVLPDVPPCSQLTYGNWVRGSSVMRVVAQAALLTEPVPTVAHVHVVLAATHL
jgi:hypothetical protein